MNTVREAPVRAMPPVPDTAHWRVSHPDEEGAGMNTVRKAPAADAAHGCVSRPGEEGMA